MEGVTKLKFKTLARLHNQLKLVSHVSILLPPESVLPSNTQEMTELSTNTRTQDVPPHVPVIVD